MQLNQIPKMVSYKEHVYNQLKEAIIRNDLKSGEMLNERILSAKFGISRTPIREALQWLERDGWVETEPCRGTWVRSVTIKNIEEIYQMRLVLEALAVELAINRIGEKEIQELSDLVELQVKINGTVDHKVFTDTDLEFHLYIAKLSGNQLLIKTLSGFMDVMSMYLIRTIRKTQPYSIPIAEHKEILKAMIEKNIPVAKNAVMQHIENAYNSAKENI